MQVLRRLRPRALSLFGALAVLAGCGGSDNGPPQLSAATGVKMTTACSALAGKIGALANTTLTATSSIPAGSLTVAGQPVREHCLVTGKMHERVSTVDGNAYAIGFEMRLPTDWNGRFLHQGNGGIDGAVVTATGATGGGPLTHALQQGFAVLSSDAGHPGSLGPNFGIDPQARLDYGYQAVAKLTPMAKSVIASTYGKGADRSYFAGCSNGGRHAMIAATRYANDYDGILAGAPGYNLPKAALANIAGGQLYASVATSPTDLSTGFTTAERRLVSNAVLSKCDALDGATDGLVQDVQACRGAFDLARDVPTCAGARDGSCLSAAQKTAIGKIFSGPTTSNGTRIYSTFPYDPGIAGAGIPFWEFTAPLALDSGAVGLIFKVPPDAATGFNGPAFTLSANLDLLAQQITATNGMYTESAMSFMTPPNPTNMATLKDRGGKIIVYHGVSDPIFSVDDSETWYKGLQAANGGDASNFARFFRVPGMGHCSGGPATDQFDALSALVNWVEQGQAPASITATARGAGNAGGVNADLPATWAANRTRPLCPYPLVARYNGTGDVESASSFSCR
ncbi:tannase/feruloyl esterase family alpha/beta hydrolase [Caenimonas sedimenti]|uniref:Tannase/feruloyl esterase family alpha/beta hydrolase n=1 Tax=Caenimonas sedimenti TaxID=2596921 RepID=A0A562ZSU6_9BURK|nr:tannase/feruloyl esterase family alpha/beta hydrolase [Caenimonas sedimenti]TWO71593.1 tannase/feruloyl esterase family alpha/beta hydrolase [Caenimonas sedimenti]